MMPASMHTSVNISQHHNLLTMANNSRGASQGLESIFLHRKIIFEM